MKICDRRDDLRSGRIALPSGKPCSGQAITGLESSRWFGLLARASVATTSRSLPTCATSRCDAIRMPQRSDRDGRRRGRSHSPKAQSAPSILRRPRQHAHSCEQPRTIEARRKRVIVAWTYPLHEEWQEAIKLVEGFTIAPQVLQDTRSTSARRQRAQETWTFDFEAERQEAIEFVECLAIPAQIVQDIRSSGERLERAGSSGPLTSISKGRRLSNSSRASR